MLGNKYKFKKDYCNGTQLIKSQLSQIKIAFNLPKPRQIQEETAMTMINYDQPLYGYGHLFHNTWISYCCFIPYWAQTGYEVELNNEIISTTRNPDCCQCCFPNLFYNKKNHLSGKLHWNCFSNSQFLCCNCIQLTVTDDKLRQIYKIKKQCCTCGNVWYIRDMAGNKRGKIESQGCLYVRHHIQLPQDSLGNKINLLSVIPYLP